MPKENKTEYALLGLLCLQPMSGYDIKVFTSQSIGFFWQENYGQIYPSLKKLWAKRLVTRKIQKQRKRPDRQVYTITAVGRKRLGEWLRKPAEPEPVRIETLLKLFFGRNIDRTASTGQLQGFFDSQIKRLKSLQKVQEEVLAPQKKNPNYPYWFSTWSYGIQITRARIRWCRQTIKWLEKNAPK